MTFCEISSRRREHPHLHSGKVLNPRYLSSVYDVTLFTAYYLPDAWFELKPLSLFFQMRAQSFISDIFRQVRFGVIGYDHLFLRLAFGNTKDYEELSRLDGQTPRMAHNR